MHPDVAAVVAALLEQDEGHRLLVLEPRFAELALTDGSRAFIIDPQRAPEEVEAALRELIEQTAGMHLKIVLLGSASLRDILQRIQPRWMPRRMIQVFHVGPEGSVWWGRRVRPGSPWVRMLERVAHGEGPQVEWDRLQERRAPPPGAAELEAAAQQRAQWTEMQGRPRWMSRALVLTLLAVFGLEILWGGSDSIPTLVRMGANTSDSLGPEPFRLLASVALHFGALHVAVNAFVLLWLGGQLERWIGGARLACVFVLAGLGGALASALAAQSVVSVGASGGIWGLLGAAGGLSLRPQGLVPQAWVPALRRSMVSNIIINLLVSFAPGIDLWAHLGGGIVGLLIALTGAWAATGNVRAPRWVRAAALACTAAWLASLAVAFERQRPWDLVGALEWTSHDIGGLRFEAPRALGEPRINGEVIEIGDAVFDPMAMALRVSELPHPATPQDRAAWNDLESESPEGLAPSSDRTPIASHPWPAFEERFKAPNGLELRIRNALGPDFMLHTELGVWKHGQWEEAASRMLDSIAVASSTCPPAGCRWPTP